MIAFFKIISGSSFHPMLYELDADSAVKQLVKKPEAASPFCNKNIK
jgi:hypothetical protein